MNFQPLSHQHGGPLRPRVEDQLDFKTVTWSKAIGSVEGVRSIKKGDRGDADDHEYFGEPATI